MISAHALKRGGYERDEYKLEWSGLNMCDEREKKSCQRKLSPREWKGKPDTGRKSLGLISSAASHPAY